MHKKLEDYQRICPKPFVGIFTESTGEIMPCCELHRNKNIVNEFKNVTESSFQDYYFSKPMVKLRNAMKNNTDLEYINEVCKNCITKEKNHIISGRIESLMKFYNEYKHKKKELEAIIATDSKPTFLLKPLLMSLGQSQCNLKCGMCADVVSSARRRESIELGEIDKSFPITRLKHSKAFKDDINWMLKNCLEFEMPEAEPLMLKVSYEILKKLDKEVTVELSTNGTIDVDKFIEHTKNFKKVDVFVSIEGGEKVNSYIRYPSKWQTILKNFDKLSSCANMNVKFITTMNALSVGKLTQMKHDIDNRPWTIGNLIYYNDPWMLSSIPDDVKQIYLNDLHEFGVKSLVALVEDAVYIENNMIALMKHCERRDALRGTLLIDIFPEWKTHYEEVKLMA